MPTFGSFYLIAFDRLYNLSDACFSYIALYEFLLRTLRLRASHSDTLHIALYKLVYRTLQLCVLRSKTLSYAEEIYVFFGKETSVSHRVFLCDTHIVIALMSNHC